METKKLLLMTHTDLDGYGCKLLMGYVADYLKMELTTIHTSPGKVEKVLLSLFDKNDNRYELEYSMFDLVVVSDLSVTEEGFALSEKISDSNEIMWFDHHNTSVDVLEKHHPETKTNFIVMVDDNGKLECGTSLIFRVFDEIDWLADDPISTIRYIVETIRMYDTYSFENGDTPEAIDAPLLNTLFWNTDKDEFINIMKFYINNNVLRFINIEYTGIDKDERVVPLFKSLIRSMSNIKIDYEDQGLFGDFNFTLAMVNNYINGVLSSCIGKEDAYVKRKVEEAKFNSKQNDGNLAKYFSDLSTKDGRKLKNPKKVYAVVADQCQPRIGKGILRELDADIAVVIDTSLEKASLYSIGDTYDVSEFAKCFGGGGHKNASGFTLSYGWGQTTINSIMLWIHSLIA